MKRGFETSKSESYNINHRDKPQANRHVLLVLTESLSLETNSGMSFTALTDPFTIQFEKDGVAYQAVVTYAKQDDCSEYFFNVAINEPAGLSVIHLKEKPTLNPEYDYMVWVDDNDKVNMLYQQIGNEIEHELKKMGVFLIDAPLANHSTSDNDYTSRED